MKPLKAKYIGIFYTFLMVLVALSLLILFFNTISEGELLNRRHEFRKLLESLDLAIPVALVVCFGFASKLGPHIILGIGKERKATWTLIKVLSITLPVTYLLIDLLHMTDFSRFDSGDLTRYFAGFLGVWIFSYFMFLLPGLLLGYFLKQILLRYKP